MLCVPLKYIAWNVKMYRIDLCYFAVIKGNKVTSCHTKKNNNKLNNIELTKTERVKKLYPNNIRKFKKVFCSLDNFF